MSTDDMSLTPEESADGINLEDHEHILSIALLKSNNSKRKYQICCRPLS
jgi:hypothetical protein